MALPLPHRRRSLRSSVHGGRYAEEETSLGPQLARPHGIPRAWVHSQPNHPELQVRNLGLHHIPCPRVAHILRYQHYVHGCTLQEGHNERSYVQQLEKQARKHLGSPPDERIGRPR